MEHKVEVRTYMDGGINWNWYLQGQFNDADQTVTILFCDRWHKYDGGPHPLVDHPRADMEVVKHLGMVSSIKIINHDTPTKHYRVLNPKEHSWQYRDFSQKVMEGGK